MCGSTAVPSSFWDIPASIVVLLVVEEGMVLDIIVGIVGAFLAGLLVAPLLGISPINQNPFNFPAVLVSAGGAVILLVILNLFRQRGYHLR